MSRSFTSDADAGGFYAESYNENRSAVDEQSAAILDLMADIFGDVSTLSVLDVGSGPGRLAIPIRRRVHRLVCVEPDPIAVMNLRRREKENNIQLEVYPVAIQSLSGSDLGLFDLVILSHVIHWIDIPELFRLSKQYIKDGGYILLSYFDVDRLKDMLFYKISGDLILTIQEKLTPSTDQIVDELCKAGFAVCRQFEIPINVNYGNKKLEGIINKSGTLAWQQARNNISERDYLELKLSALARLEPMVDLTDTEYRKMVLAKR